MAQEKFEKGLTTEWVSLSDIITVDASTTYYIQNRGANVLIAVEPDSEPSDDDTDGVLVQPYKILKYKKGTNDLYLRAFANMCSINISSEG